MVVIPSRPVTALVVVIVACIVIAAIYAASGRSDEARAEQLSDVLERSLNSSAIAIRKPAQPVAFCNATGDCAGNRCVSSPVIALHAICSMRRCIATCEFWSNGSPAH